jgi:ketosteroid isomerase-like protein
MTKLFSIPALVLCSILVFTSCKNSTDNKTSQDTINQMTDIEKEAAKKEISNVGKFVIENAAKLDVETAIKPYLNDSTFLVVNPDGSFGSFEKMKTTNIEAFKQLASFKQTTINEQFRFLTRTEVLYTWFGKNELQLKTGEKVTNESYVGTMLFKKINNEWKIAYAHESASPAVIDSKK